MTITAPPVPSTAVELYDVLDRLDAFGPTGDPRMCAALHDDPSRPLPGVRQRDRRFSKADELPGVGLRGGAARAGEELVESGQRGIVEHDFRRAHARFAPALSARACAQAKVVSGICTRD